MSCIRLNLTDRDRTISGEVHGGIGDRVIASLSAEPETIHELELALARFDKPTGDRSALAFLRAGENFEPYDAGIVIVDLAAQVVMIDSTYSIPAWVNHRHSREETDSRAARSSDSGDDQCEQRRADDAQEMLQGDSLLDQDGPDELRSFEVGYHDGEKLTNVRLPYRIVDSWMFVGSVPEYEGICQKRRELRATQQIKECFDARAVLFGRQLSEFLASEILDAANLEAEDLFTTIHARWLTTPRPDLQGRAPREWLLEKREFIDFDLHSRELQWSLTGECPPPLLPTAHAYRFAGFGTHEIVLYYDLIRLLLDESYQQARSGRLRSLGDECERLELIKSAWLEAPGADSHGKAPALIIEWERRRIPLAMSGKEAIVDEDCPVCQAMAEDLETPVFWHLDDCGMDDQFEFSFFLTREEWEAERRRREEFNRAFDRQWRSRESKVSDDGAALIADQAPF